MDEKQIIKLIMDTNNTLSYFKKGGWIDCRRTPYEYENNIVESLEEYVEARFNRECWSIPEFTELCELLDGHLFKCTLEGADEVKKKYKNAVMTLVKKEEINNPSQELCDLLENVERLLGGNKIRFNGVKVKIQYKIIREE